MQRATLERLHSTVRCWTGVDPDLGLIADEKMTWERTANGCVVHISKYVGVMYKVKHHVSNQALRMFYHSLINSRVQYRIAAWGSQYRWFWIARWDCDAQWDVISLWLWLVKLQAFSGGSRASVRRGQANREEPKRVHVLKYSRLSSTIVVVGKNVVSFCRPRKWLFLLVELRDFSGNNHSLEHGWRNLFQSGGHKSTSKNVENFLI